MKRFGAVVAACLALSACSLNDKARGIGESVVAGATGSLSRSALQSPQRDSLKATMDSIASYAGQAIAGFLRPQIDTAIDGVLVNAKSSVREMQDTLAMNVGGSLNRALQELLRANLAVVNAGVDRTIQSVLDSTQYRLRYGIQPIVETTVGNAIDAATDRLAGSLEGALLAAMMGAADSIARKATTAAGKAADKSVQESTLLANVKRFWPFALLGLLAAVVGVLLYQRHKREQMLSAIASVVQKQGNDQLKEAIKMTATVRRIEPQLNKWLAERGYLVER